MFSKSCQYAIQSVLYVALHGNEEKAIKTKEISETQDIPVHFLGKVMQVLVKNHILISTTGPTGGFILAERKRNLNLLEIVEIIDGLEIFNQCGIGLKKCSDLQPCPIHKDYKVLKTRIRALLESKTIERLVKEVRNGHSIVSIVTSPLPECGI